MCDEVNIMESFLASSEMTRLTRAAVCAAGNEMEGRWPPVADSSITKKALASALKELMEDQPFAKISVGEICERCLMNRKSFYYHFRDKYDLVNWIFDTEFVESAKNNGVESLWDAFKALCNYFYQNRNFYRKVLKIEGQNSFAEHFRQFFRPIIARQVENIEIDPSFMPCYIEFVGDALLCAIERWLADRNALQPDDFVRQLTICTTQSPLLPPEESLK